MQDVVVGQIFTFFITICAGIAAGILFDFYRILRWVKKPKIYVTYISDLLFWLVVTLTVFCFLIIGNWGEIRLYVFIGIVIGLFVYFKYLSRNLVRLMVKIRYFVSKVIGVFARTFAKPVAYIKGKGKALKVNVGNMLFRLKKKK